MKTIFNHPNLIYWLFVALTISLATTTLGRLWRRQENARWTLGYAVVFAPGLILVYLGYWDLITWIGLFFAVGISGALKVGYQQYYNSKKADQIRRGGYGKTKRQRR